MFSLGGLFGKSKKAKAGWEQSQKETSDDKDVGKASVPCKDKKAKGSIVVLLKRDKNKKLEHDATVELQQPAGTTIATKKDNRKVTFKGLDPGSYTIKTTLSPKDELYKITPGDELQGTTVEAGKESMVIVTVLPPGDLTVEVVAKDTRAKLQTVHVHLAVTKSANQPTAKEGTTIFKKLKHGPYDVTLTLPQTLQDNYVAPPAATKIDMPAGQDLAITIEVPPRPAPKIEIAAPKIIIVKRDYHGKPKPGVKPHRIKAVLSSTIDFDGEGVFTWPAEVKVYDSKDSQTVLNSPLKVPRQDLIGKTVYMEAVNPSSAPHGTTLHFRLQNGSIPPKPPVSDKITCVKLTLKIHKPRPENGGAPPVIDEAKKLDPGRAVLEQGTADNRLFAHRAMLVVERAEPHAYSGKMVLKTLKDNIEAFSHTHEKPAKGQQALEEDELKFANTASHTLWVQGKSKSDSMGDSGWKVELEEVPDQEGDRVTMSVLKTELRLFKSRKAAGGDPEQFSDDDKIDKGRFLHKQDTDKNHARAKLVVRKVEPADFVGKLFLTSWNVKHKPSYSESKAGSPRVEMFDDEDAGSAFAFETDIDHPSGAADDLKTLWVQGKTDSADLIDTEIRLGVREVDNGCERCSFTVVEFTKIKATIKSTPAHTVRAGHAAPADHHFENTKHTEDFANGKNEPLVLMRNAQPDITLVVTVKPDKPVKIPILWKAVRNKDDHATIGGKDDLPTVTADGSDVRKATLSADQKGSFRIRPYIDCNGVDEYSPKEPSIPLNLVLADATLVSDNSAGLAANLTSGVGGGVFSVSNGDWPGDWATAIGTPGGAGMTMEVIADVTGGGADGRLGLDKVFGGLVNNLAGNDIILTYTDVIAAGPGPPATYTVRNRYVLNPHAATGNYGGTPMFRPGHTAPNLLTFPVLDTGRPGGGLGADSATMTRSGMWDTQANQAVGIRYTLRCIDSPGRGFLLAHPDHGNCGLTAVHYVQQFTANFCFWTNVTRVRTQSGDPADRVYCVLRSMDWAATGDWTIAWTNPGGAGWVATPTNTNAHNIAVTNPQTFSPVERVQDHPIEVRPPSGITNAIVWVTT